MLWILLLICLPHMAKAHGTLCFLPHNQSYSAKQLGSLAGTAGFCGKGVKCFSQPSLCACSCLFQFTL